MGSFWYWVDLGFVVEKNEGGRGGRGGKGGGSVMAMSPSRVHRYLLRRGHKHMGGMQQARE